ncbi:MAG: UDP-N-acetylmuramate: L-alanyl-gamma-D-glutamyl-meso-diaminopimelate ligase [Gammaproteobacteria bacterium]|jgi:UDP-N-acetylmuramate: L-alanyl-gamma-D-glutamyl-meso-diaminopimelate ligase
MKIYLLGICGTFMAGIAMLAREMEIEVEGSDTNVYPPMSTQLADTGITIHQGYDAASLPNDCDMFIVGNAISRGNPQFEAILDKGLPYRSAPQWLYEQVLQSRWVLAVAGTHGKTTTSSMLAWILQYAGLNPGYLIGGIGRNFSQSAKLGDSPFFVIEADEYDSALFDKRSKFVHYHPRTLILNNLEFDHADIFDDLNAIKRQFHHLVRALPRSALIVNNDDDEALLSVLEMGCWSEKTGFSTQTEAADFSLLPGRIIRDRKSSSQYQLQLSQAGQFNALNALAAILAARHAGVTIETSIEALAGFKGVKRRQEIIADINGVRIIDDFAHHPTAIAATLGALKDEPDGRLVAVLDIRSNTMKMGVHADLLGNALKSADRVYLCDNPGLDWDIQKTVVSNDVEVIVKADSDQIIEDLLDYCQPRDQIVIMSNGGFDNIHQRLIQAMQTLKN